MSKKNKVKTRGPDYFEPWDSEVENKSFIYRIRKEMTPIKTALTSEELEKIESQLHYKHYAGSSTCEVQMIIKLLDSHRFLMEKLK